MGSGGRAGGRGFQGGALGGGAGALGGDIEKDVADATRSMPSEDRSFVSGVQRFTSLEQQMGRRMSTRIGAAVPGSREVMLNQRVLNAGRGRLDPMQYRAEVAGVVYHESVHALLHTPKIGIAAGERDATARTIAMQYRVINKLASAKEPNRAAIRAWGNAALAQMSYGKQYGLKASEVRVTTKNPKVSKLFNESFRSSQASTVGSVVETMKTKGKAKAPQSVIVDGPFKPRSRTNIDKLLRSAGF